MRDLTATCALARLSFGRFGLEIDVKLIPIVNVVSKPETSNGERGVCVMPSANREGAAFISFDQLFRRS